MVKSYDIKCNSVNNCLYCLYNSKSITKKYIYILKRKDNLLYVECVRADLQSLCSRADVRQTVNLCTLIGCRDEK